jgi:Psq-like protein
MHMTPEYAAWAAMKTRCLNPNDRSFKDYGARGIHVCKRWLRFENFFADMGVRPSAAHSLERQDNDKGYSKSNCYWATAKQQQRNTRRNRHVVMRGKKVTMAEAAELVGIPYSTFTARIRAGKSHQEALRP